MTPLRPAGSNRLCIIQSHVLERRIWEALDFTKAAAGHHIDIDVAAEHK